MTEEDRVRTSIAEHVLWCCEKRDALVAELEQYQDGTLSIGERKIGEPMNRGTIAHITYLLRNIEQLDRVIKVYSAPGD